MDVYYLNLKYIKKVHIYLKASSSTQEICKKKHLARKIKQNSKKIMKF